MRCVRCRQSFSGPGTDPHPNLCPVCYEAVQEAGLQKWAAQGIGEFEEYLGHWADYRQYELLHPPV